MSADHDAIRHLVTTLRDGGTATDHGLAAPVVAACVAYIAGEFPWEAHPDVLAAYAEVQQAMASTPPSENGMFPLGIVSMTAGVVAALGGKEEDETKRQAIASMKLESYLRRHREGDFGDIDPQDRVTNKRAANTGQRVLSSYEIDTAKVWVITEWDRSITTVLLPSEY